MDMRIFFFKKERIILAKMLVIKAHPLRKNESRTVAVLDFFLARYRKSNPDDEITVLDLYEKGVPEIDGEILHGWQALGEGEEFSQLSASQQKKTQTFDGSTEQFLAADKIVIANPLWNLNIPTRLKAWIDTIVVAGKTFRYTPQGPKPLTAGKKALHIQSAGGTYSNQDAGSLYVSTILHFAGIKEVEKISIEGADYAPEKEEEIMKEAFETAEKTALHF